VFTTVDHSYFYPNVIFGAFAILLKTTISLMFSDHAS